MNKLLKDSIENIYQQYQPLASAERGLIGLPNTDQFEKTAEQLISDLSEHDQKRIRDELFNWGPLMPLIDREDLFDILIQGPDHSGV